MAHEYEGNMINEFDFKPDPKENPSRDPKYLAWVRLQPCQICGGGPCQAAHQHLLSGGTSSKPDDFHAIPCCPDCHMAEHSRGVLTTWNERSYMNFKDKHGLREYLSGLCGRLKDDYLKQEG